jgi:hypothetical protein
MFRCTNSLLLLSLGSSMPTREPNIDTCLGRAMVIPGVNDSDFTKPIVIDYRTYYVVVRIESSFTSTNTGLQCVFAYCLNMSLVSTSLIAPRRAAHLNPEYNKECSAAVSAENVPFAVSCIGYQC